MCVMGCAYQTHIQRGDVRHAEFIFPRGHVCHWLRAIEMGKETCIIKPLQRNLFVFVLDKKTDALLLQPPSWRATPPVRIRGYPLSLSLMNLFLSFECFCVCLWAGLPPSTVPSSPRATDRRWLWRPLESFFPVPFNV